MTTISDRENTNIQHHSSNTEIFRANFRIKKNNEVIVMSSKWKLLQREENTLLAECTGNADGIH